MGAYSGPKLVQDGLVLCLDAANPKSYPGTGTAWTDLSGENHHATLLNGVSFSSANMGTLVFDGDIQHATLEHTGATDTCSYEVFIKPTDVAKDQMFIGSHTNAPNYSRFSLSRTHFSITAGLQRTVHHTQTLLNDTFYHIVTLYNIVQPKIYVNRAVTLGAVADTPPANWRITRIGRWTDANHRSFVGHIALLRVYSRELLPHEIEQNFNAIMRRFA